TVAAKRESSVSAPVSPADAPRAYQARDPAGCRARSTTTPIASASGPSAAPRASVPGLSQAVAATTGATAATTSGAATYGAATPIVAATTPMSTAAIAMYACSGNAVALSKPSVRA